MNIKTDRWFVVALLIALHGCKTENKADTATDPARAKAENLARFTDGMNAYLAKRGDLCLGRSEWPVEVPEDAKLHGGGRDIVQMPALEKVGVVHAALTTADAKTDQGIISMKIRRYQLTDLGRESYLDRATRRPLSVNDPLDTEADFCPVKLTLDKVVGWEIHKNDKGPPGAVVSYTYKVEAPAWTHDPAIRKAFPAVDRVISGAGTAQLKEGFTMTGDGWTANELLPPPAMAARR